MKKIQDWECLKELNCPICYGDLKKVGEIYSCKCGFKILKVRLEEIVGQMFNEDEARESDRDAFDDLRAAD